MEKQYGIIGQKLAHSYSPLIHKDFGYDYRALELTQEELPAWVARKAWAGYNVTIPYKQYLLPLLDRVDPAAARIGAVNTVVNRNGILTGYNTDFGGMCYALEQTEISLAGRHVLILGTGGTSLTATAVCDALGAASVTCAGRTSPVNYSNIYREASHAQVLINTTPVGMFPTMGTSLVDPTLFPHLEGVLDVIPNPIYTELALRSLQAGLRTACGLDMLVAQAVLTRNLFLDTSAGQTVPLSMMLKSLGADIASARKRLWRQVGNVVLTGMPGCGKTVVGQALARKTGLAFLDTDLELEKEFGCSAGTLLKTHGTEWFREKERALAQHAGRLSGTVIATGGGLVTDETSLHAVAQNGVVIYIERSTDRLAVDGRPLSAGTQALAQLYAQRHPLYRRYARWTVDNNGTLGDCVDTLFDLLKNLVL